MSLPATADTRGQNIKLVSFAREAWAEAQQKDSKFKVLGTRSVSMNGENFRLFTRRKKAVYTKREGGPQLTPSDSYGHKARRALFTESYHTATQADIDELTDNQVDLLMDYRQELVYAQGRLCDRIILSSLLHNVNQEVQFAAVDRKKQILTQISLERRAKDNVFCAADVAAADGSSADIGSGFADLLEDINYIFATRDVIDEKPVVTLTPKLQRILRKDMDFKNAENVFSKMKGTVSMPNEVIDYRGFDFIPCSNSILPEAHEATGQVADGYVTARVLSASHVDVVDYVATGDLQLDPETSGNAAKTRAAQAALYGTDADGNAILTEADYRVIKVAPTDLAYIWIPSAVLFSTRMDRSIMTNDILPEQSQAKQVYSRVNFGATLLDDQFSMVLAVGGSVANS